MAILVEEEKDRSNLTNSLGWAMIGLIVIVAAYYILFAPVTPAVITPPASLQNVNTIGGITFDPTTILNGASYQALKQYVPEPVPTGPVAVGRQNPFLAQ
jgi:hypothetical protein